MGNDELRCPKCRNNLLCFRYYSFSLTQNAMPSSPKKEDWDYIEAKRYRRTNKGLEVFNDGNWKECNHRKLGENAYYVEKNYLCKCGFYGDEGLFVNDGSISQIEEKVYENGRKYIGQFKNGKREGYGIMFFPDGGRYEGNWENDLAHGKGIEYYKDGDRYEGEYFEDEEDGEGVYYYKNGDRIMGNYKNGKKIGKYVKLCSNGEIQVINFDN